MLSMDPFPRLQGSLDQSGAQMERGLRRGPVRLTAFAEKPPQNALRQLEPGLKVKELELASFTGVAVYLAKVSQNDVRIIPIHGRSPMNSNSSESSMPCRSFRSLRG
jgi:hypothetical protein